MEIYQRKSALLGGIAGLCITFAGTSAAYAADAEEVKDGSLEEVVVTGSRIKRSQFESLQPSIVVGIEEIKSRGVVNIADILNEQAAFGVPGSSPTGPNRSGSNGQNQVDFLGLGSSRTLTLVNGRRFVSSNPASNVGQPGLQVDLNAIPVALIERVETIAVGGAPIYGTDAIAGTVNIILKDNFEGLELSAQTGKSLDYGDAESYRASLVYGANFNDDRGNITLAVDYSKQNGLIWPDRPKTSGRGFSFEGDPNGGPGKVLIEDATVAITSFGGIPLFAPAPNIFGVQMTTDPSDPNAPLAQFDDDGNLIPFTFGTGPGIFVSGGDGADLWKKRALLNDLDRINGNIFLKYQLTDDIRLKAEGWFSQTKTKNLVDEGWYQTPFFGFGSNDINNFGLGAIPVTLSNPFITPSTLATLSAGLDFDGDGFPDLNIDTDSDGIPDAPGFFLDRSFVNIMDNTAASSKQTLFRTVLSLDGDIKLGDRDYSWEASYVYGQSRGQASSRNVIVDRFVQAVNVIADPISGAPVCADPSDGCSPLNVMSADVSQDTINFVTALDKPTSLNEQHLVSVGFSGTAFELPAGDVQFAMGFDYRVEKSSFTPSVPDSLGIFSFQRTAISGEYSTREFYAETLVPLLGADSGIDTLELEGAIRYVDNSVAGGDTTWTIGGRFRPVPELEFRANVTRSIRAPGTTELFSPEVQIFILADDPCDSDFIGNGSNPSQRATNCSAAGIAQPFDSKIADGAILGIQSGNPDLNNETADSWSVGVVYSPKFIEGLTVSADWINIDIKDAITSLAAVDILEACFDSTDFPNEAACNSFTRDSEGQVDSFRTGFVNVAKFKFSGLSAVVDYRVDAGEVGAFSFNGNMLYTKDLTRTVGASDPDPRAGLAGASKYRITATLGWHKDAFGFVNQYQWKSAADFDLPEGSPLNSVPAWGVLNSTLTYDFEEQGVTLQVNVNNVFNKMAPLGVPVTFGSTGGATLPAYFSGILGRMVSVTARASF